MAKTQPAAKSAAKFPEVIKAAATKGARQVAEGTVSGPKGKKLVDAKTNGKAEVPPEQREGERRQSKSDASMKFSTAALSTPAAHPPALSAEQQNQAKFLEAQAELAKKFGVNLPAVAQPKAASTRLQANGITRPATGTTTGNVWAAADAISASQGGSPAQVSQVKAHPLMQGVNDHTVKTQYSRWRQFNGIKGRIQIIKPVQAEGNDAGLAAAHK